MIGKEGFISRIGGGIRLLDGATGTALMAAGMPLKGCKEAWILEHPREICDLQRRYVQAGSQVIYTPTLQANPLALAAYGLEGDTVSINARLAEMTRRAAPDVIIAGDVTTLRMHIDTGKSANRELMTETYRRQIRGLVKGGADVIIAETLMHPMEAEAVLEAAAEEKAGAVLATFPVKKDGRLYSGHDAGEVFARLEKLGAAAVGINCVAAEEGLWDTVARLSGRVSIPFICKPNAGRPMNGIYPVAAAEFADIVKKCAVSGAALIGGCCGTAPEYIEKLR